MVKEESIQNGWVTERWQMTDLFFSFLSPLVQSWHLSTRVPGSTHLPQPLQESLNSLYDFLFMSSYVECSRRSDVHRSGEPRNLQEIQEANYWFSHEYPCVTQVLGLVGLVLHTILSLKCLLSYRICLKVDWSGEVFTQ